MATRAAMADRDARIQARLDLAVLGLAQRVGIEIPPPFPHVRDPYFRQIDERERMTLILERLLEAGIMSDRFSVVNDRSGDAREVTMDQFQELQAQGYRVVDINRHAQITAPEVDASPPENPTDEQSKSDADLIARETFPEADAGEEDTSDAAPVHDQDPVATGIEADQSGEQDFNQMTVAQLREHLEGEGVEVPNDARKADLVALAEQNA